MCEASHFLARTLEEAVDQLVLATEEIERLHARIQQLTEMLNEADQEREEQIQGAPRDFLYLN